MIMKIFKKIMNNIKMNKRNNKILKFGLYPNIFDCLDKTMNKESKVRFCNYLKKYNDIKKWSICSDYCLDDKNKNRRGRWRARSDRARAIAGWRGCGAGGGSTGPRPCRPCPGARRGGPIWLVERRPWPGRGWRWP